MTFDRVTIRNKNVNTKFPLTQKNLLTKKIVQGMLIKNVK